MGKFSEMDILLQESYNRGFKDGWRDAADSAKNILSDILKPKPKKHSLGEKIFDICLVGGGIIAMALMMINMI